MQTLLQFQILGAVDYLTLGSAFLLLVCSGLLALKANRHSAKRYDRYN